MPPHLANFVFLIEMFHHVGQAGLKLLTSGDEVSAEITSVSHRALPDFILFYLPLFLILCN